MTDSALVSNCQSVSSRVYLYRNAIISKSIIIKIFYYQCVLVSKYQNTLLSKYKYVLVSNCNDIKVLKCIFMKMVLVLKCIMMKV